MAAIYVILMGNSNTFNGQSYEMIGYWFLQVVDMQQCVCVCVCVCVCECVCVCVNLCTLTCMQLKLVAQLGERVHWSTLW